MKRSVDCVRFTGYKPCSPGKLCRGCAERRPRGRQVLIINLDALGAVLMTTALLPAIKRRDPASTVHWVTMPGAVPLLANNPHLDRVWPYDFETVTVLQAMRFDRVYSVDKAHRSDALAMLVRSKQKLGFGLDRSGAIVPFNREAEYAWRLGLDDDLKFRRNAETGVRFLARALKLDYRGEGYVLDLTPGEKQAAQDFRTKSKITKSEIVIGFNTGCSDLFPNKKMTVDQHVALIKRIRRELPKARIVLLGGKAETERNAEIRRKAGAAVIASPTGEGIRRGIVYVDACDLVVTGDTSAMHMAIALQKQVVAWFGLSCAAEIELFGRGEKIVSPLPCAPCWKKTCDTLACVKQLDLGAVFAAVARGVERLSR
ncbi:MAG: glycosyltransferase family 9 protein [Candidatus Edwardsbacteria bacterium]|nr:glycosyltransferase family 9 protein [Candidatus Edwardsbacteria bacterium]